MIVIAVISFIVLFIVFRLCQRFYYLLTGHQQYFHLFYPRDGLEKMFVDNSIQHKDVEFISSDNIKIKYRVIGTGPKKIYLANGVGTDLYMWLPIFEALLKLYPNFFSEVTLYAPSYRGLFGSLHKDINATTEYIPESETHVTISIATCGDDLIEVMKDAGIVNFDTVVCWSLGAQMALTCFAKYPSKASKLFLMNPATGCTLHRALQPVVLLPSVCGNIISSVLMTTLTYLKSLIHTSLWVTLKAFAESYPFLLILELMSFFGGFPPEQGPYFQEYMRDVFSSRYHTRGLLDLILSLDAPCPPEALALTHPTVILSGWPDFMTGVYLSKALTKSMPNSKHIIFSMASHFLLLEWPGLVAEEMAKLVFG